MGQGVGCPAQAPMIPHHASRASTRGRRMAPGHVHGTQAGLAMRFQVVM